MFLEQTHTVKKLKGRVRREEGKETASEQTIPAASDTNISIRGKGQEK